jgi:predicted ATPase
VNDSRQMAGAVVAALELPGQGPAQDVAIAWLAAKRALLVLDDCEHLVAACADFCEAALQRCPELTIIATSQEALGVPGETRWPVSSMRSTDALQLFEARARLIVPDFRVVATSLETVTQICERLDGMPLAIELAAARVGMMAEQEILSQLSDRFHLLTGGSRTAPERQQTMIATIDWSYRLLTEEEALLFRRLAVFRGGFTLGSAQAICADGIVGSVLDLVAGLVQNSMVLAERTGGSGTRYRLLESQLAYAEDRLRETAKCGRSMRSGGAPEWGTAADCGGARVRLPARAPPTTSRHANTATSRAISSRRSAAVSGYERLAEFCLNHSRVLPIAS